MKQIVLRIGYILLVLGALIYSVPNFEFDYKGKQFSFTNLPSAANSEMQDIIVEIPRVTDTYEYTIESIVAVPEKKEWNTIVAKDRNTMQARVEEFLGKNYELRLENIDNKAKFTLFTTRNIGDFTSLLTTSNSEFTVSSVDTTTATTTDTQTTPKTTKLDFVRQDFGRAEIVPVQQSNEIQFQVRMPIATLNTDKLKLINSNIYSSLNIFAGGKDRQGAFLPNDNNLVTHIVITSFTSIDEAAAAQTYLNTDGYGLGYALVSSSNTTRPHAQYVFPSLIAVILVITIFISIYYLKVTNWKQVALLFSYVIITVGAAKLFGVIITLGFIVTILSILILAITKTKPVYLAVFGMLVGLLQLFDVLSFISLTWTGVFILLILGTIIWRTNYDQKA